MIKLLTYFVSSLKLSTLTAICFYILLGCVIIMKALDIVRTPKGGIAFITETNDEGAEASINFIGDLNVGDEHNAWWSESDLEVISSIPKMLAEATAHPFGSGVADVEKFF